MVWIGGEDLGDVDEWKSKWSVVDDDTTRMAVPGGWLYRTVVLNTDVVLAFVPSQAKKRTPARQPERIAKNQERGKKPELIALKKSV
jgi:hypothetical protein